MNTFNTAETFKALSDENRIKILIMLNKREMNAGQLLSELKVTQPTLSHHMKILCDCGLLNARKDGKWTYYSISDATANTLISDLKEILSNNDGREGQEKISLDEPKSSLPSHLL